jgi:uridine phosphorylase
LHNLTQVLYFAGNSDLEYIRIGTSGGIGVEPGSVVLTDTAYMPNLIAGYKVSALGKDIIYPTVMDKVLNQKILQAQHQSTSFKLLVGNSIAADDFYLGQARFDGAIKPRYTIESRNSYFEKIKVLNILNFEMESTGLASFCNRAQIPATMIASIIINRLNGDQVTISTETLNKYSDHSQEVAINYVLCNQHNLNK